MEKTFRFETLPVSADELRSWGVYDMTDPFCVAAMSAAAFCRYMEDAAAGTEMINLLKGPQPLSPREEQFLRDRRMEGYSYVPKSYFAGAVPENNYTPDQPFTVTVFDNPYSYDAEGYVKVFINSGGADTERPLMMRNKPSTGEYFLWEWMGFLSGIRMPVKDDPWA